MQQYEELKKLTAGKYILGSTDRLSPLSGVVEKLEGYKQFLAKNVGSKFKNALLVQVIQVNNIITIVLI